MKKPFVRSINNRVFAGVFGAIADHFGWDSSLVRLAGALLLFFYQGLVLLYILAALFLKEGYTSPAPSSPSRGRIRSVDDFLHRISSGNQLPLYLSIFALLMGVALLSQWTGALFSLRLLGVGNRHLFHKIWGLLQLVAVLGLLLYWMKRRKR